MFILEAIVPSSPWVVLQNSGYQTSRTGDLVKMKIPVLQGVCWGGGQSREKAEIRASNKLSADAGAAGPRPYLA